MAEDLRAEIQQHIDHLNKAEQARLRLLDQSAENDDPLKRARIEAQAQIELDVWRSHWTWLFSRGIDFRHMDRVGMEWRVSPLIDLVALVEAEVAAKAAERERMRITTQSGTMAQASL